MTMIVMKLPLQLTQLRWSDDLQQQFVFTSATVNYSFIIIIAGSYMITAEIYCIPNDVALASLTADDELLTKASTASDVELIFMSCQQIHICI